MKKQEMIDSIYGKIAGRFHGNRLEVNLQDILHFLYSMQEGEWKLFEDNAQFPQIILKLLDLYEDKRDTIEYQTNECIIYIYNLIEEGKK